MHLHGAATTVLDLSFGIGEDNTGRNLEMGHASG
jgi:hypothetical protein